jgi:purine-binding chemotaxis protein CheW
LRVRPPPSKGQRKIAIIENGDLLIGLLFDDTGGVINSHGATRVNFQPNSDGIKDVIVEGILKLDGGKRMVQILDPLEIVGLEKLPRVAKETGNARAKNHLGPRLNCIAFQLGHTCCAIDLRFVQEITDVPEIHQCQLAHSHILGSIELRGTTIPVVDFRGMIGEEPPFKLEQDMLKSRKLLILKLPQGYVALLVYSVDSILPFFESDILEFANVALPRHDLVRGCLVRHEVEIVILLDHSALMADPALIQAAQSYQEIYAADQAAIDDQTSAANGAQTTRATYIVFSVDMKLGLDITCVSEIINRPETLLQPPYRLDFVDGILNLRDDLITLINPRKLYNLPNSDVQPDKVLIFHQGDKKYGMTVDSVDEIITTTSANLLHAPALSQHDARRAVSEDVAGFLRNPGVAHDGDPILLLDVNAFLERCMKVEVRI